MADTKLSSVAGLGNRLVNALDRPRRISLMPGQQLDPATGDISKVSRSTVAPRDGKLQRDELMLNIPCDPYDDQENVIFMERPFKHMAQQGAVSAEALTRAVRAMPAIRQQSLAIKVGQVEEARAKAVAAGMDENTDYDAFSIASVPDTRQGQQRFDARNAFIERRNDLVRTLGAYFH